MTYASGEEPMVGDVVVCVDDRDSRRKLQTGQTYTVMAVLRDCVDTGNNWNWVHDRFKLIRQAATEQPVTNEATNKPTLTELMELRDRAEDVSGKSVYFGCTNISGLWLNATGVSLSDMTPESLRNKLTELATPKLPDELPVTLPTDLVQWFASIYGSMTVSQELMHQVSMACKTAIENEKKKLGVN